LELNWLNKLGKDFFNDVRVWGIHVDSSQTKPEHSENTLVEVELLEKFCKFAFYFAE